MSNINRNNRRLTLSELRKFVSEVFISEIEKESTMEQPDNDKEKKSKSKATSEKRTVVDLVRESITNAITTNAKQKIFKGLREDVPEFKYSEIEIISEPPKTLVRFKNVDGKKDHDVIYLINVSKIV